MLESGIKNALLLQSDEAVVVTAQEEFDDILPDGERIETLHLKFIIKFSGLGLSLFEI